MPLDAQSLEVSTGGTLEFYVAPARKGTPSRTDLTIYLEGVSRGFYLGATGLASSKAGQDELDIYLGHEGDLSDRLSYDLGLTRYIYPGDAAMNATELALGLDAGIGQVSTSLDLGYDPAAQLGNAEIGASVAARDAISLSLSYGVFEIDDATTGEEWDIGASYALSDRLTADLRYYDGTEKISGAFGLVLSWDSTLLSH